MFLSKRIEKEKKKRNGFRIHIPSIRTGMLFLSILFSVCFTSICIYESSEQSRKTILASNHEFAAQLLTQCRKLIDERLYSLFEQLITLSNDSNLRKVMISLSESSESTPSASSYISMDKSLANIFSYNAQLLDSIVVCLNNRAIFYKAQSNLLRVDVDFAEWYAKYGDNESHWLNYHPIDNIIYRKANADKKVYSVLILHGKPDSAANAFIIFNIKKSYFDRMLDFNQASASRYQSLALVSEDGVSFFGSKTVEIDEALKMQILNQSEASGLIRCKRNDETLYIYYDTLNTNGWKIISFISEKEMFMDINQAKKSLILNGLFISLGFIVTTALSAMCLTHPLHQLSERVSKVGTEPVVFDVRSQYEVAVLNDNIVSMMDRIQELNHRVTLELNQKRELEISSLQAQINPHLLYNTLYDVQQLCGIGETALATEMIAELAQFYRIGVSRGKKIISLREELNHVESYLHIQIFRYTDVFTYELHVPEQFMEMKIPKLTIQPIVENAIYHGIKPKLTVHGLIIIEALMENETTLCIRVTDNGVGMDKEQLIKVIEGMKDNQHVGKGYGLRNVHHRLRLQWGDAYGLTISSQEGVGTSVVIRVPILTQEAEIK